MNRKNYCAPDIEFYAMLNQRGFAASFGSDANAGSTNFYIGQGSSNEDNTWE